MSESVHPTYAISRWDELFENAETRRRKQALRWVLVPTSHDTKHYRRLMSFPDAASLYGCWCVILQVAAKCDNRGVLRDSDGALTAADLSTKTGMPEEALQRALDVLCSDQIGWIEVVSGDPTADPQHSCSMPAAISADVQHTCSMPAADSVNADVNGHCDKSLDKYSMPAASLQHAFSKPTGQEERRGGERTGDNKTSQKSYYLPAHHQSSAKSPPLDGGDSLAELDPRSPFAYLDEAKLRDTHRLLKWLKSQAIGDNAVIPDVDDDQKRRVLALAKQALAEGENPVGLFIALIKSEADPKLEFRHDAGEVSS